MVDTVTIKAVKGLRNNVDPERFEPGDLSRASNVDIESSGRISRRRGYQLRAAGDMHSLWAEGDHCYIARGSALLRVAPDLTLVDMFHELSGPRVSFVAIGQTVYFSDGVANNVIGIEGRVRPWGFAPPATPAASVTTGGLPPGSYQYTMTFVRSDGHESGAVRSHMTTLSAPGGLAWSALPADSQAAKVRIYLSPPNGEILYHVGDYPADGSAAVIRDLHRYGVRLRTQFMTSPPAGVVFGPWMGRIFIAAERFVFYTQPFEYELINPRNNWWAFDDPVQLLAFVDDGVYVGTTRRTYFVSGTDPSAASVREVLPYGAVPGTQVTVRADLVGEGATGQRLVYWMSPKGACMGMNGGNVVNLTGERYAPSEALYGAGVFVDRNGLPQYRVSLFNYAPYTALPGGGD